MLSHRKRRASDPADRFALGPGGFDRRAIERVAPGGKCRCPGGLHEDEALPRRSGSTMRKASPAPSLLTSPHPRATQTPPITQTGS